MIITDIHAHVFPDRLADKAAHSIGDFYGTPMYSAASVDRLLAEDGEADISYSVICNSAVTPHQVHDVNNFLAAAAASHPSFIGFGSIYPGMDGFEEELDRMMALGLRGLKIHPEFQKLPIDDRPASRPTVPSQKEGSRCCFTWETTASTSPPRSGS